MLTHNAKGLGAHARITVLGAAGYVGRMLVRSLLTDRLPVLALSRQEIDLTEEDAAEKLASLLKPNDTLVFLSAVTPDRGRDSATFMLNLKIAQTVCAATASARLAQLIYASSDAVYPFTDAAVTEDSPAAPVDLYGAMHRAREIMLAADAATPLAVVRFTAVYGTGDSHNSYGPNRFVNQALSSRTISLFGDGEETRDHLYIDDAVGILRNTIAHASTGLLNAASGSSISFRAIAEIIAGICPGVAIATSPRRSPITHRRFDIAATRSAFPSQQFTAIFDGVLASMRSSGAPEPRF